MKDIKLVQDENLSFLLSYQLLPDSQNSIDVFFSIPEDMGINPTTLSEDGYFHSSIKNYSAYYSEKLHLPLVRSRFISQNKGEQSDYRLNLNLYSFQIKIALDTDIKQTLMLKNADEFYTAASNLALETQKLVKKLRRYTPSDQTLRSYFENADNFLSWHIEQSFLKLLNKGPKNNEYSELRDGLFAYCKEENTHRKQNKYNSSLTLNDPNRITNKMRLLQRLIEYGVVFKKTTKHLNANLKRLVRGVVTAFIMAFVMLLVLNARSNFTEVTIALIAFLGVIYGLRETFKEDLTNLIWRKIQKGRAKWQHTFFHTVNKKRILKQTLWLEYISNNDLPCEVNDLFQTRRQQNKQAARLLHFRCENKVLIKKFLPGYDEIQQKIIFNLTPFVRYLKKGAGRLYSVEGQKISSQSVERRYQLNLILRHVSEKKINLERYKVTLNRSEIINIEAMNGNEIEK